jgi:hypothetical protein
LEKIIAIERIKDKFLEKGGSINITLLKGQKTFQAVLNDEGISVSNLTSQPLLPWSMFGETIVLLNEKNGSALKGDAMKSRLGETGLPIDSVEGRITYKVYGKQLGQNVFRRITPIACILEWAGTCVNQGGKLVLINNIE